jgi:hypothetical protein
MRSIPCAALALLAVSCLGAPGVRSSDCTDWSGLGRQAKEKKLVSMGEDQLAGPLRERFTSVERIRIGDCIVDRLPEIRRDFDANCQARMRRRLEEILKDYIYSCVN